MSKQLLTALPVCLATGILILITTLVMTGNKNRELAANTEAALTALEKQIDATTEAIAAGLKQSVPLKIEETARDIATKETDAALAAYHARLSGELAAIFKKNNADVDKRINELTAILETLVKALDQKEKPFANEEITARLNQLAYRLDQMETLLNQPPATPGTGMGTNPRKPNSYEVITTP
jgi:hypothetical protein